MRRCFCCGSGPAIFPPSRWLLSPVSPCRAPRGTAVYRHRPAAWSRPGLAHSGCRRDARGGAMGLGLADFRRAGISQYRRDAGRHRRDRTDRIGARETCLSATGKLHGRTLGHDDMTASLPFSERSISLRRGALTLIIAAALYEALARSGTFPQALTPTLGAIAHTLFASLADGTMLRHAAATLYRVLVGFGFAVAIGLPLGVLMARFRPVENFVLPLTSALMPIPSLAWVPVFILWFGLGNTVSVLIVFYAALFPMMLNTWSGVRSVNPIWLRAAGAMGASERALFWKVIIPGASPFIIAGLRQSFLRSWIAVIGAEMLAGSDWGLGWVIFDAKQFLDADMMLASLAVIGAIGFLSERLIFGSVECATIYRWGMARSARG